MLWVVVLYQGTLMIIIQLYHSIMMAFGRSFPCSICIYHNLGLETFQKIAKRKFLEINRSFSEILPLPMAHIFFYSLKETWYFFCRYFYNNNYNRKIWTQTYHGNTICNLCCLLLFFSNLYRKVSSIFLTLNK